MTRLLISIALLAGGALARAEGAGDRRNFRFNPIGVLAGGLTLNLDFVIADRWTLGPELNYWRISVASNDGNTYDIYALGGGARANFFANGVFVDGVYVGPSLTYARVHLGAKNSTSSATFDRSSVIATGIVGYAWYWPSFNVHLGGGASVDLNDQPTSVADSDGSHTDVHTSITRFTAEVSIGWTF